MRGWLGSNRRPGSAAGRVQGKAQLGVLGGSGPHRPRGAAPSPRPVKRRLPRDDGRQRVKTRLPQWSRADSRRSATCAGARGNTYRVEPSDDHAGLCRSRRDDQRPPAEVSPTPSVGTRTPLRDAYPAGEGPIGEFEPLAGPLPCQERGLVGQRRVPSGCRRRAVGLVSSRRIQTCRERCRVCITLPCRQRPPKGGPEERP